MEYEKHFGERFPHVAASEVLLSKAEREVLFLRTVSDVKRLVICELMNSLN
jgi:hypothetical protein